MADDERDEPSLELPSFGLGRRRRARKERFLEPDPPTARLEQVEQEQRAEEEAEPAPVPAARPLFVEETAVTPQQGAPAPVVEPTPEAGGARKLPRAARQGGRAREARQDRRQRPTRPPGSAAGYVVAAATGLLVGALTVALTWLGQRGCEALRGTSSCGDPGLLVLLAIVVGAGLVGAAALRLARVPAPGSTSALAVGLLAVLALLFLAGSLTETWAAVAVPALSVLTFALSHWVTTSSTGDDLA